VRWRREERGACGWDQGERGWARACGWRPGSPEWREAQADARGRPSGVGELRGRRTGGGGRTGERKKVLTSFFLHFILFRSRDLLIKMKDETRLNESGRSSSRASATPVTPQRLVKESRHAVWRDSVLHVRFDFFRCYRVHESRHLKCRDSSISRATNLGATKRASL
jgi:hypothetical protein